MPWTSRGGPGGSKCIKNRIIRLQTDRQDTQTNKQTDRQTDRQTDIQTDRQTDKMAFMNTSKL